VSTKPGQVQSTYDYNAAGERISVGGTWARTLQPAALANATYNEANQQLTFGQQTLTYDLNGSLTSDGQNTYTWNARNQLAAITGPTPSSFVYDRFGRRSKKTISGTTTDFLYDGLNAVQEKTGATTADLLVGLSVDERFMRSDPTETRYLVVDALGSTVALADGSGTIQTPYTYEAFGATATGGASSMNQYGYTGRENDGAGFYYYRARFYHAGLQRFISEDPIGFAGGDMNLYSYLANAPSSGIDPMGLYKAPGHTQATTEGLAGQFSSNDIALIVQGNVGMDASFRSDNWFNFATVFFGWSSADHAMPAASDAAIANAFGNKLFIAACNEWAGRHEAAMAGLGETAHTAQDKWAHKNNNALPYGGTLRQHAIGLIAPRQDPDDPEVNPANFERAKYDTALAGKAFKALAGMMTGRGCK